MAHAASTFQALPVTAVFKGYRKRKMLQILDSVQKSIIAMDMDVYVMIHSIIII